MENIRDRFDDYLKSMCASNYFAVFLNELIYKEFQLMSVEEIMTSMTSDLGGFVYHEIPINNKIFDDLQFVVADMEGYCSDLEKFAFPKGGSLEEYRKCYVELQQTCREEQGRYERKQAGVVKIILR
ncbi:MAG: hypothetical protein LLG97_03730, partial [Deltaproteobacteria bacterium]|nr:hypothetical protein [Deltaproteobacteria bacterium]